MKQRPTFSIIIPVFDLETYIEATLRSVVAQTYPDWEAIVVDDASRDGSLKKAEDFARQDPRIRVMRNSRSKGVSGARNTGIDHSNGQWIAFLDGDDLLDPRALEFRFDAAAQFPDCEFISGDFLRFSDEGDIEATPQSLANNQWRRILHTGETPFSSAVSLENPVDRFVEQVLTWTGCATVRTDLLKRLGGFNERLQTAEDDQMWIRVAASVNRMVFEPRSLALYRQRPNSLTSSGKALHRHSVFAYSLLLADPLLKAHKPQIRKKMGYFAHQNTFFYRSTRQRWRAIFWSVKAITIAPLSGMSWRNLIASLVLH